MLDCQVMKYWKIYAGIYLFVLLMGLFGLIRDGFEGFNPFAMAVVRAPAVALIGLIRRIGYFRLWLWKIAFVLFSGFLIGLPIFGIVLALNSSESEAGLVIFMFVISVVLSPAAYGTYLYRFRSNALWERQSNHSLDSGAR